MVGRRRKQSAFEDWIEIAARLPWWLSLLIAGVVYLVLHVYAAHVDPPPKDVAELGAYAGHGLWRMAARIFQYVLPAAFVMGSVVSAVKAREARQRYDQTSSLGTTAGLLDMSWREFEILVGEYFQRQGYSVSVGGGAEPDGGVDIELNKDSERFLVQCKQWRATKVGVDVVRQLYGVMAARGAVGSFVVTSGAFTADAQAFAKGRNIQLVGGKQLVADMRRTAVAQPQRLPQGQQASAPSTAGVACPKCGAGMVKRIAKQGPNAGHPFWGCSNYPSCRGIRSA
jgi:restriction system protein